MTLAELTAQRLHNHHLLEKMKSPEDVVGALGAVQAQDFTGGKWAIGLRCRTTDADVTKAFNDGKILRTHMLRPTWHFVAPKDIRWMQALTAPRVHAANNYYNKKLGVDDATVAKSHKLLRGALRGGNQLTKAQIAELFAKHGLASTGLHFTYLLVYAELEALVCSGALQGKQHTFALVEDRAPGAIDLPRDKALAELTRRFFTAHGPAQIADFAWWSSLTTADIKEGVALAKLKTLEIDGKMYYYAKQAPSSIPSPVAHFLPNYDEYFIAYKDRAAFSSRFKVSRAPSYEDMSYHLLALDGQLAGGWKRQITGKEYTVKLNPFVAFTAEQQKALAAATKRLSDFAGLPVKII